MFKTLRKNPEEYYGTDENWTLLLVEAEVKYVADLFSVARIRDVYPESKFFPPGYKVKNALDPVIRIRILNK